MKIEFDGGDWPALLAWTVLCMICGAILTGMISDAVFDSQELRWRHELIDRGHAEYNQTTGEWQWKERGDE